MGKTNWRKNHLNNEWMRSLLSVGPEKWQLNCSLFEPLGYYSLNFVILCRLQLSLTREHFNAKSKMPYSEAALLPNLEIITKSLMRLQLTCLIGGRALLAGHFSGAPLYIFLRPFIYNQYFYCLSAIKVVLRLIFAHMGIHIKAHFDESYMIERTN